ncbi:MAG: hypothetical protein GTO54_06160 [Nitrososphaeria archaeon]|nr:hypothetical protein [Nitrososphaeria archaeon]
MGFKVKRRRIDKRSVAEELMKLMTLSLNHGGNLKLADRYVELARGLSMKSRVRITKRMKHFICRGCKRVLIPGVTARFRVRTKREKHIAVTCLRCGHIHRRILP